MRALLLLAALSGCATELDPSDEVVDLTPSADKADGDTSSNIELAAGKTARYVVRCFEVLSCDLALQVSGWPSSWGNARAPQRARLATVSMKATDDRAADRKGEVWVASGALAAGLELITHSSDRAEDFEILVTNTYSEPVEFTIGAEWY